MRTLDRLLALFVFAAALATAQPVITGGPVNAASYALVGLPNASIAQGSMFIVFGRNMGPPALLKVSAFPLPANLGGTSIRATVGGTSVDAIMIYTSAGQVAAILPSSTPAGDGTLTLTFNGQTSAAAPIRVVRNSIGIFTRNSAGSGPGIAQNFNSQTDQPLNTLVEAAQPGQVMILWGTGLGPVSGNEAAGAAAGRLAERRDGRGFRGRQSRERHWVRPLWLLRGRRPDRLYVAGGRGRLQRLGGGTSRRGDQQFRHHLSDLEREDLL